MASKRAVTISRRTVSGTVAQCRTFTSGTRCMVNPLLNLSHFSASKEAQFFSKERRIPREEFHPHLQLIRASEVDPFAPAPGSSPTVVAALKRAQTGQTDMQTAYSLAISNLGQQVVMMRREVTQAHAMLATIHEKYKREERNSFILLIAAVGILSFVFVKTDALDDLKSYARETTSRWRGFDWEWLGNPPPHKVSSSSSSSPIHHHSSDPLTATMTPAAIKNTQLRPVEVQSDRMSRVQPVIQPPMEPVKSTTSSRWSLSRLFWAAPSNSNS